MDVFRYLVFMMAVCIVSVMSACQSTGEVEEKTVFLQGVREWNDGNYAKAARYFRTASKRGNPLAASRLGECYLQGKGVEQDLGKAFSWFKKAAYQGQAAAQARLGMLYQSPRWKERDLVRAYAWYEVARLGGVQTQKMLYRLERGMSKSQVREARMLSRRLKATDGVVRSLRRRRQ